jgi:hypothetical protein
MTKKVKKRLNISQGGLSNIYEVLPFSIPSLVAAFMFRKSGANDSVL